MSNELQGKSVAILATHGFEQSELFDPKHALEECGARVSVVSPESNTIRGWNSGEWGEECLVDVSLNNAKPEDYDALMLPGGVINPDRLRLERSAVDFIRHFFESGKPVAAICHGPWTLIEADVVKGRRMTSWRSLKTDLINAGADWVDQEVITDKGLVTSRSPKDLPAFNDKMIEEFREGRHEHKIA